MVVLTNSLVILLIIMHLYFLYLEMFAWTSRGPKVFRGRSEEFFKVTKEMAANQGLYNGFLAAGLIWTFFIHNPEWHFNVSLFFISCIALAGVYGGLTTEKKIFYVQGVPAFLALISLFLFG
ncbi:MAG TPA: DUF1304 domain-containing protein [Flavobacteriales bacterium]|jgi:putative membrane protein|nr:DUF1304 domain-containing protein [Flavobacteriales bacterium]